jgi:hypothetical protein
MCRGLGCCGAYLKDIAISPADEEQNYYGDEEADAHHRLL